MTQTKLFQRVGFNAFFVPPQKNFQTARIQSGDTLASLGENKTDIKPNFPKIKGLDPTHSHPGLLVTGVTLGRHFSASLLFSSSFQCLFIGLVET